MGYFAETMALFEFKGDAEEYYAAKRRDEYDSGRHGRPASLSKSADLYNSTNMHKNISGKQMVRTGEDYRKYQERSKNDIKSAKEWEETRKDIRKLGKDMHSTKSCKESFEEAFASVIL